MRIQHVFLLFAAALAGASYRPRRRRIPRS